MSQVTLQGNPSGTGVFTVAAPNSNTNRTLNLPDAAGDFVLNTATQTLTNKTLTSPTLTTPNIDSAQVATVSGTAPLYLCRAWVNFNGTNGSIRGSGNVSSVTFNGNSDYTVNFATAMPDTNYNVTSWGRSDSTSTSAFGWVSAPSNYAKSTTSIRIRAGVHQNTITYDSAPLPEVGLSFFR